MYVGNMKSLGDFAAAVGDCIGQVWLESEEGDRFNLKSVFSQYIAFDKLFSERGEYLKLVCSSDEDRKRFEQYFSDHPENRRPSGGVT